jgi:5-oxoprolinase (ATP-hydrolysing) subunit A
MAAIDLNSDLGEGFGDYRLGDDAAMLGIVSSVNVACGFHAGDPHIMADTFAAAKHRGVAVGAHPGYPDLQGFGRRLIPYTTGEIERLVAYQIGAAMALASLAGHRITHVKAHGALANLAADEADVALAVVRAAKAAASELVVLAIAGTEIERAAERMGMRVAREIFADRAYTPTGRLVPRKEPGAVIHDPQAAAARVLEMLRSGALIAVDGTRVPVGIDSICVHGDTAGAVAIAAAVREAVTGAGFAVRPFAS